MDGGYTAWTAWTTCTASCEGGTKTRERTCSNPKPQGEGETCKVLGEASEQIQCNVHGCPGRKK